jgi:hypothetical protein
VFVDREFLQRLALDTRNDARNKPTRLTHLDNDYECAILHESGAADFTVVVGSLHGKLHQLPLIEATIVNLSRRLSHSIF